jgi:hypothetical protein
MLGRQGVSWSVCFILYTVECISILLCIRGLQWKLSDEINFEQSEFITAAVMTSSTFWDMSKSPFVN